jgi:hypothetical protein
MGFAGLQWKTKEFDGDKEISRSYPQSCASTRHRRRCDQLRIECFEGICVANGHRAHQNGDAKNPPLEATGHVFVLAKN